MGLLMGAFAREDVFLAGIGESGETGGGQELVLFSGFAMLGRHPGGGGGRWVVGWEMFV